MTSSLPPKVIGEIEGRLDVLVLRPALIPPLQPTQALDFVISWWGDEKPSVAKLLPNNDEAKFIFNICCDINRFQKYLDDAEKVALEVFVSDEDIANKSNTPIRCIHKNKKEWNIGEYIGNFLMKDIKFNSRGEFVYEDKILSKYKDICGSLVIFMLYTPKFNLKLDAKNFISSAETDHKELAQSYYSNQTLVPSSDDDLSALRINSYDGIRSTSKINKSSIHNTASSETDKEDFMKKTEQENNPILCDDKSQQSYISDTDLIEFLPDKSFLITRLLSFVDSGAIQLSDVPTLLQICQGRLSPQIDVGKHQIGMNLFPEHTSSSNVSLKTRRVFCEKNDKSIIDDSETIQLTDVRKPSPVRHHCKHQSQMNFSSQSISSSNVSLKTKYDSCEKDENLSSGASLLIIHIATINLKSYGNGDISKRTKPVSSKLHNFGKKIAVRQRSKICYFLQISLYCQKNSADQKTALFVSRQIDNGVVVYNSKEILPLPNDDCNEELKGYMKVRVICRKLGERLGTEIGIGLVSLKNLYVVRNKVAQLKLWLPNKENCNESHQTIGKLEFSVAFALLGNTYSSFKLENADPKNDLHDSNVDHNWEERHNILAANQYFLYPSDSVSKCSSSQLHNDDYGSGFESRRNCKKKNYNKQVKESTPNYQDFICSEDTNAFSHKEIKQKERLESRYDQHLHRHFEDVNMKNYKKSRRKLFGDQRLNICDTNYSPQNNFKGSNEDLSLSTGNYVPSCVKVSDGYRVIGASAKQKPQEMCLIESAAAHKLNCDRSILYADVSSCSDHSLQNEMNCEVLLEIREGHNFPMLLSNRSDYSFAPSTYVRVPLKSSNYETSVSRNSVSPKWNFRAVLKICKGDFNQTHDHFLLFVFHCRNGVSPGTDDPILGFVALEIHLLWTSVISLSGWFPVLNKDQNICGEINITLTSLKATVTDNNEVSQEKMTLDNNSLHKLAADCKESSTQTSQICCNSLYCQHHNLGNHKFSLSLEEDSFLKCSKYCKVSSWAQDEKEDTSSYDTCNNADCHKLKCYCNVTKRNALSQSEFMKQSPSVDNQTFIISKRTEATDVDELQNLHGADCQDVNLYTLPKDTGELASKTLTKTCKSHSTVDYIGPLKNTTLPATPKSNIETFTWMNQLETLDTPCASYIDLRPSYNLLRDTLLNGKVTEILSSKTKAVPTKWKRIKCRIAANINMPKNA